MRGQHEITVRNARVQYKFTVSRNITILRGDSATGKTMLIEMIAAHQRGGERSGVEIRSDKPCVVLTEQNWELMLSAIRDSIVFIDEGADFVRRREIRFERATRNTVRNSRVQYKFVFLFQQLFPAEPINRSGQ